MNNFIFTFALFSTLQCFSQTIEINFPAFYGKTYEFIIFQGSEIVKVKENDTIPKNGLIKIDIPAQYAPYTGMCRWLITNTATGGGLDMAIPGHGFKVSCLSDQPNESNIVWEGYDAMNELNRLNGIQQNIIDKYEVMSKAIMLYGKDHAISEVLAKEQKTQYLAFEQFKKELQANSNYNARFLPIVNLIRGIAPVLTTNETEKANAVESYITHELNFNHLYTSGHWTSILQSWVQIHAQVFQNKENFANNFKTISDRILEPAKYTDFVGKVTYYLSLYGKDDFVTAITPAVVSSGKITSYIGKTMEVYVKALVGSQAPDLVISETNKVLKSSAFAQKGSNKTLLIFYKSDCGPCEAFLSQLPAHYKNLQKKGIDIIAISADENEQVFKQKTKDFPWARSFCDYKGMKGSNFSNYAVMGTPTIYVIDKKGTIVSKLGTIEDILAL
jgi:peroxiredoxin